MAIVYKYTDLYDDVVKYVGIVWSDNRTLADRVREHQSDDWYEKGRWKIEYLVKSISSRTDAELLERHYISKYETYKWYNKSKAHWGECTLFEDYEDKWLLHWKDKDPMSNFVFDYPSIEIRSSEGAIFFESNTDQRTPSVLLKFHDLVQVLVSKTCLSFMTSSYDICNSLRRISNSLKGSHAQLTLSEIDGSVINLTYSSISIILSSSLIMDNEGIKTYEVKAVQVDFPYLVLLSHYLEFETCVTVNTNIIKLRNRANWEPTFEEFQSNAYLQILSSIYEKHGENKYRELVELAALDHDKYALK